MSRFKPPEAEESVSCNLIPMIDIMFLLLLFFMLSADMSQRELDDIKLPVCDKAKEDPKQKEGAGTTTINLLHLGDCPAYKSESGCRDQSHWICKIRGQEYTDWARLKADLVDEAKISIEDPDPKNPEQFSSRIVNVRADHMAPYGVVQRLIQLCASIKPKLYKIEPAAAKPSPEK